MSFKDMMKRTSPKRLMVGGICALAIVAAAGLGVVTKQVSSAATVRECSQNSIDYKNMNGGCGAASPTEFIKDVKANSPSDLKAIYENYGLAPSEYTRFVDSARMGTAYKDGRIVVDGQTVATDAASVGRDTWAGRKAIKIAGKTYYTSSTKTSFNANSIPVMVMFDKVGKMEFAALTACGNPITGKPQTPTYACNELKKTPVSGKTDTYNFTTSASAGNGAKIVKVEYDFGDGSAKVSKTSPTEAVAHTFTKSSTVTVKVSVSLPGKQTIVVVGAKCNTKITVTPPTPPKPSMSCDQLKLTPGKADEQGNIEYTLAANASVKNATIQSYSFTFGDKETKTVTTGATTASATHTYAPGTYSANVSVKVLVDGKAQDVTSPTCVGSITIKPLECKPGVPVGSPECQPQPEMTCTQLVLAPAGAADTNGNVAYKLTATASATNATIQSYSFVFGDQTQPSVVTSGATTASVTHSYAPGTYNAKVTVSIMANGKAQDVTSAACVAPVTVNTVPKCTVPGKETLPPNSPECQETCTGPNGQTHPKGSEECETCTSPTGQVYPHGSTECQPTCTAPNGQTYPEGSDQCKPVQPQVLAAATELPNTGPGQVAAIFAGATLAGAIAHRWFLRRRVTARNQ
jgi:hypothetical protein